MNKFKVGDKIVRMPGNEGLYKAFHRGTVIKIIDDNTAVIDTPAKGSSDGRIKSINWEIVDEDEYSDQEIKELVESAIGFKQINELEGEKNNMGCFSYLCKECGKGINSSSFDGELVNLYFLNNGEIIEEMSGEYDSYGRVFVDNPQRNDVQFSLRKSLDWGKDWGEMVMDHSDEKNLGNGFAAIHAACFKGKLPSTKSKDDPDQGWNKLKKKHLPKKKERE